MNATSARCGSVLAAAGMTFDAAGALAPKMAPHAASAGAATTLYCGTFLSAPSLAASSCSSAISAV